MSLPSDESLRQQVARLAQLAEGAAPESLAQALELEAALADPAVSRAFRRELARRGGALLERHTIKEQMQGIRLMSLSGADLEPARLEQASELIDRRMHASSNKTLLTGLEMLVALRHPALSARYWAGCEADGVVESLGGEMSRIYTRHIQRVFDTVFSLTSPEARARITRLSYYRVLAQRGQGVEFPPQFIRDLPNLREIDLSGSSFEAVPEWFTGMPALRELRMGRTRVRDLPDAFGGLAGLEVLDLSGSPDLAALPAAVLRLPALRVLDLSGCDALAALPDGIGRLSTLQELRLDRCGSLRELPESLGQLPALRVLSVNQCRTLERLPASLSRLPELQISARGCSSLAAVPTTMRAAVSAGGQDAELAALPSLDGASPAQRRAAAQKIRALLRSKLWPEVLAGAGHLDRLGDDALHAELRKTLLDQVAARLRKRSRVQAEQGLEMLRRMRRPDAALAIWGDSLSGDKAALSPELEALPEANRDWLIWSLLGVIPDEQAARVRSLPDRLLPEPMAPPDWGILSRLRGLRSLSFKYGHQFPAPHARLGGLVSLKSLSFLYCRAATRLPEDLGSLPALEELTINDCAALEALPAGLGGLAKLKHLSLESCPKLAHLPASMSGLAALQALFITRCGALRPSGVFAGMRSLRLLYLGENGAFRPTTVRGMDSLDDMKLGWVRGGFPEGLDSLGALRTLRFSCSGVAALPPLPPGLRSLEIEHGDDLADLGALPPSLTTVKLQNCPQLARLPSAAPWRSARHFGLERVGLEELPADLLDCAKLRAIELAELPNLRRLPEGLGRLPDLCALTLVKCPALEALPGSIARLEYLARLHLSGSAALRELPAGVEGLAALSELSIDETGITAVPDALLRRGMKLTLDRRQLDALRPQLLARIAEVKLVLREGRWDQHLRVQTPQEVDKAALLFLEARMEALKAEQLPLWRLSLGELLSPLGAQVRTLSLPWAAFSVPALELDLRGCDQLQELTIPRHSKPRLASVRIEGGAALQDGPWIAELARQGIEVLRA